MSLPLLRVGLVAILLLSLAALPRLLLGPLVSIAPAGAPPIGSPVNEMPQAALADSLIENVIGHTPFRVRRRPAQSAFAPNRAPDPAASVTPSVPKPALVLTGIVWEREPAAVIEGLPGSNGPRVVRARERVGQLRVRRIEREQVLITGLDTMWTLRVREPWK
jgi:hypothetical protein